MKTLENPQSPLERLMQEQKLTIKELSLRSGVSPRAISGHKTGQRPIQSYLLLAKLAHALRCEPMALAILFLKEVEP